VIVYFDASALVKHYVDESGTSEVEALIGRSELIATGVVTGAEVPAALAKAVRLQRLASEEAETAVEEFWGDWPRLYVIELHSSLVRRAGELAWRLGLRGYDAVHLASALAAGEAMGEMVPLVCFDHRLREAAEKLGVEVLPEKDSLP